MRTLLGRRDFIKTSMLGAGYLSLSYSSLAGASNWLVNRLKHSAQGSLFQTPDVEIVLTTCVRELPLLPGAPTKVWQYTGELIKGPEDSVTTMAGSYLGPVLRLRHGQKVRMCLKNELPEETITHWHGLHLSEEMDGHPHYVIGTGQEYIYEFIVEQRAGTYWYHPHPHGRTGFQVYHGLAGFLIVEDAEEKQLGLPAQDKELLFCLQDRRLDENNQLLYLNNGGHDRMMGMMGDKLFINGQRLPTQEVATCSYRLRILNGSNARIYNLAWEDGADLQIIGNDGGLLEKSVNKSALLLGPGERVDLIRDFSTISLGNKLSLMNKSLVDGRGQPFPLLSFQVTKKDSNQFVMPEKLSQMQPLNPAEAVNADAPKVFTFKMDNETGWTIDGKTYEMHKSSEKETVRLGTMELWELANNTPGMGMPHPIHLHGAQFQIIERIGAQFTNYLDLGWKDTVLVMPGERVRLLKRFDQHQGYFVYHCHNLEHEDMGMMREFHVQ